MEVQSELPSKQASFCKQGLSGTLKEGYSLDCTLEGIPELWYWVRIRRQSMQAIPGR